jgi:hypothetical protein
MLNTRTNVGIARTCNRFLDDVADNRDPHGIANRQICYTQRQQHAIACNRLDALAHRRAWRVAT